MNKCKFSLIELLVTIAIIAILAGILLPTLNQVRQKAMGLKCKSNLKQIGTGVALYVSDCDYLPAGGYPEGGYYPAKAHILKWAVGLSDINLLPFQRLYLKISLEQYRIRVGNMTILRCPSRDVPWICNSGESVDVAMHYAMNYFTTGLLDNVADQVTPEKITIFKRPSSTIHIADSGEKGNAFEDLNYLTRVGRTHNNRANLLWLDAHVSDKICTGLKKWEINPKLKPGD